MAAGTKIEWADDTFNPWIGCTKVSAACDHCYAEAFARRTGGPSWGAGAPRRRTSERNWRLPFKWNDDARRSGIRRRVFCASLADVFDQEVPDAWRIDLMTLIVATPSLDWLLLTKRPKAMADWSIMNGLPDNVWAGTTVEDQKMADLRIPELFRTNARKRFLSIEPLLGPISLHHHFIVGPEGGWEFSYTRRNYIDWVIAGGESGPGARPSHPDWFRTLRDQCAAVQVPFLFKQWGDWAPVEDLSSERQESLELENKFCAFGAELMMRVGKKAAGRALDGKLHDEVPA